MDTAFDLEVARRLPLADAAFRLLDHAFDEAFLDDLFERKRERSYAGVISFSQLVRLVAEALLGHRGSAHQTFRQAREDQTVSASVQAVYGKLRRVPVGLSAALLAEASARLQAVGAPPDATRLPASLRGFRALAFDGKKLKYVAKRLKAVRGLTGAVYGGKLLVVQDMATGQAVAAEAAADGEAADNPLVPAAVAHVRALPDARPRVWVGDRAFCDYPLLGLLAADADHFVVRFNASCGFHADPAAPARAGTDAAGRPFREQVGWLGKPGHPHRVAVRQITLPLAAEDLIVVTSLLDGDAWPAADVLALYRGRWGIEGMFLQVTQTFDLRRLIGGTPEATVFQAMLTLLIYNATLVIRDHVAAAAREPAPAVSLKLFFDDVVRDLTGWLKVIGAAGTVALLAQTRPLSPAALRACLQQILGAAWTNRWLKAPTRQRPPKPPPRAYICGGHTSVHKILNGEHTEISFKANASTPPAETAKDV